MSKIIYFLISLILIVPLIAGATGAVEWIPENAYCVKGTTAESTVYAIYKAQPTKPPEPEFECIGTYKLTAYCGCGKCSSGTGITSTGAHAREGYTVAVDPDVIQYGTRLSIDNNYYVAEDCGGDIKGARIDIYFDDHDEALKFGVKYIDVYVWR